VSESVIICSPTAIELAADPINPDWVIEGSPQVRSRRVAESADGTSATMVWSCTAGRFTWYYPVEEMLHIISGEVFVTNEKGEVVRLGPGDMAFFPAGSVSAWHVPDHVLKIAVCRHRMLRPFGYLLRAWNKIFYTLTGFSRQHIVRERRPAAGVAAGRVAAS
jgi:uncharacterized protein